MCSWAISVIGEYPAGMRATSARVVVPRGGEITLTRPAIPEVPALMTFCRTMNRTAFDCRAEKMMFDSFEMALWARVASKAVW